MRLPYLRNRRIDYRPEHGTGPIAPMRVSSTRQAVTPSAMLRSAPTTSRYSPEATKSTGLS